MPATERSYTADLPSARLYLDTDFLINCLFTTEPHHGRCRAFMVRLFQHGLTTLYLSTLTWMEYAHVIAKESFRKGLPPAFAQQFQLDQWDQPLTRDAYMGAMLSALQKLLDKFDWEEISLTADVRRRATQFMAEYKLDSHDAVHLASANYVGVFDLASLDRVFRRVDGLYLWNDQLYASEAIAN